MRLGAPGSTGFGSLATYNAAPGSKGPGPAWVPWRPPVLPRWGRALTVRTVLHHEHHFGSTRIVRIGD